MKTKNLFLIALIIAVANFASAQKLPNKQKLSVRSPANIKIDGDAKEWDYKFQAYNNATDIFYTLSNDDENLYLTVKCNDQFIIDKILRGGLTLTINHTLQKKDNMPVSVTYPVLRNADMWAVTNALKSKAIEKRSAGSGAVQPDELNKLTDAKSKLINIAGIKNISDEAISVYNENGIKAASLFDKNLVYTYELALPLKYLALPDNRAAAFSYNLIIHEPAESHTPVQGTVDAKGYPRPIITAAGPTDFWGEYTLANK